MSEATMHDNGVAALLEVAGLELSSVRPDGSLPVLRGVVTNLIAGALLLGVGIACLLKGRANRRKQGAGP